MKTINKLMNETFATQLRYKERLDDLKVIKKFYKL